MALSPGEQRALAEIAGRVAAEDPYYSRRMSEFGGYTASPLGLPSRWALLPVVLVALALAAGVLLLSAAEAAHAPDGDTRAVTRIR